MSNIYIIAGNGYSLSSVSCSWRRVKGDYLHHFSLPRLDLLAWVLITKLAPTYYRKLEVMLNDIGRFRELPKWRKDLKVHWIQAMKTSITIPLNERYRPNAQRFVCTCPQFVISRFLICKHLVQLFHPVDPRFFLEVTRNRTTPFWSHPSLKPISAPTEEIEADQRTPIGDDDNQAYSRVNAAATRMDNLDLDSEDDDDLIDTRENRGNSEKKGCKEEMENYVRLIRDFCDGLEFQVKFQDPRFLNTLEREGALFFNFAQNCLSRERRANSSRAASPSTWERSTANAIFYQSRPCRDRDT